MPSYRKAIKAYVRRKVTGKGVALKHPIRTTRKVKQSKQATALKKFGPAVMGPRAKQYEKARKYLK